MLNLACHTHTVILMNTMPIWQLDEFDLNIVSNNNIFVNQF